MGIIVNQDDTRTELQKRIAQQLSDKAKKKQEPIGDLPDGVEDSAFVNNTVQTKRSAWVWILLAGLVTTVLVVLFLNSGNN